MKFYQGDYSGLIEFSAAVAENPFGSTLLDLLEKRYDSIEVAVEDISETFEANGLDGSEEGIISLLSGGIVPDEDVVDLLAELAVEPEDEAATARNQAKLYDSAVALYELHGLLEDQVDEVEDEEVEVEDTEEEIIDEYEEEGEVEEPSELEAAFSQYAERQDALDTRLAVTDALAELREVGSELVRSKHMTPHTFSLLFSRKAKDDYMNFSQTIEQTDYTPEEYIMCMDFALSLFEEAGPITGMAQNFSTIVEQEISDTTYNFSQERDSVDEEARDLLNLLRGVSEDK